MANKIYNKCYSITTILQTVDLIEITLQNILSHFNSVNFYYLLNDTIIHLLFINRPLHLYYQRPSFWLLLQFQCFFFDSSLSLLLSETDPSASSSKLFTDFISSSFFLLALRSFLASSSSYFSFAWAALRDLRTGP